MVQMSCSDPPLVEAVREIVGVSCPSPPTDSCLSASVHSHTLNAASSIYSNRPLHSLFLKQGFRQANAALWSMQPAVKVQGTSSSTVNLRGRRVPYYKMPRNKTPSLSFLTIMVCMGPLPCPYVLNFYIPCKIHEHPYSMGHACNHNVMIPRT